MQPECVRQELTSRRTEQEATCPLDRLLVGPFFVPRAIDTVADPVKRFRIVSIVIERTGASPTSKFPFRFPRQPKHFR